MSSPETSGRRFRTFSSAIEVPAYRWYLLSQVWTWGGLSLQIVIRGFLAYEISGSFAVLGLVELSHSLPRLVFAIWGGVVADRASRRVIIQSGQVIHACVGAVLALLFFADLLTWWHLAISAFIQGAASSFNQPAKQGLIPEVVGVERLMNALALNSFVQNGTRLSAPLLAGLAIAFTGAGWAFVLNTLLHVLAVLTLFPVPTTSAKQRAATVEAMATAAPVASTAAVASTAVAGVATVAAPPAPPPPAVGGGHGGGRRAPRSGGAVFRDMGEAIQYLGRTRILIWLLMINGMMSILTLPYQRLLPGFVRETLSAGSSEATAARMLTTLLALSAVGALCGSLLLASLPNRRRGILLVAAVATFGASIFFFSLSTALILSAAIAFVIGFGQSLQQSLVQILIQTHVDNAYRGRISSIMMLDDGIQSFGVFGIALLADQFGGPLTLGVLGVGLMVLSIGLWTFKPVRSLE